MYTVSLVAEQRSSQFHDVFWWSRRLFFIPRWNEQAATLESFDKRVRLFVSSTKKEKRYLCGPRLLSTFDPEGDTFRYVRDNLTNVQMEAADGSGALMIVKTTRLSVGPKSIHEGVRLLLDFFRLDSLRRNYGETMRHWTRRFTLQYSKVGQALNASNAEINKDFLHENIRGILLAETSGLTSNEFASVLATSGTTSAEGENIGNSWKFSHLVEAFCTQWGDAALAARDAKARKSEAVVAEVDNFDLSELSEAAARIENAISWNDTDPQIVECEDDDDDHYEDDVDWYAGDCDDELDDTAYTAGTPTDDPELLEQFDGNLEDADASASQEYASASRSFQETRELLARVKSARGCFPVVGIGAFDGLAQPSTDQSRGKGKKGKKENPLLRKVESRQAWAHLAFCQNHRTHVSSLVLRCPRSVRLRLVQLVLDHITLLVFVLVSACCGRQVGHRASECPNKGKPTALSPGKRAVGTYALGCAVFDSQCYGATVEEIEQDPDEEDIEDFVAFSIKSLEGFAILDGGATKTVSGFMSVQAVADRYEGSTIETTDVGFTFAGGETEAASTKICMPHAEFPHGISVNVVLNESTPFLIGLDVLREYGLVIDFHYNHV